VKANEELDIYAGPEVDEETFTGMCAGAADEKADVEIERLDARYRRKIDTVQKRLGREQRELREDEAELDRRKGEEFTSYAETALGFFGLGRKRSVSSAMSKRSRTARAEEDVQESIEEIASLERELTAMKEELQAELEEIEDKWEEVATDVTEIHIPPYKKDIDVHLFGVAWVPHYLVQVDDSLHEFAAYTFEAP
jgi:DNA repair exonuclease SbcCD ATPase subunit